MSYWLRFLIVDIVIPAVVASLVVVVYDAMVNADYTDDQGDEQ